LADDLDERVTEFGQRRLFGLADDGLQRLNQGVLLFYTGLERILPITAVAPRGAPRERWLGFGRRKLQGRRRGKFKIVWA
jgi:hypothetical protein